jgi:hypothetical protein
MRFGLPTLLCDTSRLLRDLFYNNSLSPLILNTCFCAGKSGQTCKLQLILFWFRWSGFGEYSTTCFWTHRLALSLSLLKGLFQSNFLHIPHVGGEDRSE